MKIHLAVVVRRTEWTCLSLSLISALLAVECGCSWEKPGWAKRLSEVETRQGMQGEWRPVYAEENGKEVDKPTVMREQRRVIIDGNSLLMERFKDGVAGVYYGLFEISPETNAFDWMGTDPQGTAVKWIGRYELDNDELKLCFHYNPNGAAVRPKDFSTADAQGSSKTVLYVLKRHGSAPASEKRSVESAVVSVVPPLDRKEPTPSVSSSNGKTATSSGDSLPTRIAEAASGLAASQKSESTDAKVSLVPDLQKKAMEPGVGGRSDQEEGSSSVVNKTTGRSLMASRVFYDEQKNSLRLEYDFRNPEQLRDFTFDERAVTSVSAGVRIGGAEKMMHTVPFSDGLLKAVLVLGTKEREQTILGVSDRCTLRFDGVSQGANSYCLLNLFSDERKLASRNCDFFANEYGVEYFVSPRKVKAVVNGQELAKERDPAGGHIGHFRIHGGNGGVTVKSLKIEGTPQKGWLVKERVGSNADGQSARNVSTAMESSSPTWLAALNPTGKRLQNGWFEVGAVWGVPIEYGQRLGYKSIFLHARPDGYSSVTYWLGGRFAFFESGVFVPKVKIEQQDPATPLVFEVWCDGQKKWQSQPVAHMKQMQDCRVSVKGANDLELRVVCPGRDNWAAAVWFQPRISTPLPRSTPDETAGVLNAGKFQAFAEEGGWVNLFDGKSFSGWRSYSGEPIGSQWVVADGTLCLTGGGGGDIVTEKEFRDFEFQFQWKVAPGSNSGVMYRVQLGYSAPHLSGFEYQVLDDVQHPNGADPKKSAAALYALIACTDKTLKPVGEWNMGKIVLQGDHLEHWLNNKKVLETELGTESWKAMIAESKYKDWKQFGAAPKGMICLQDHGDKVWFRDLKIRELPSK